MNTAATETQLLRTLFPGMALPASHYRWGVDYLHRVRYGWAQPEEEQVPTGGLVSYLVEQAEGAWVISHTRAGKNHPEWSIVSISRSDSPLDTIAEVREHLLAHGIESTNGGGSTGMPDLGKRGFYVAALAPKSAVDAAESSFVAKNAMPIVLSASIAWTDGGPQPVLSSKTFKETAVDKLQVTPSKLMGAVLKSLPNALVLPHDLSASGIVVRTLAIAVPPKSLHKGWSSLLRHGWIQMVPFSGGWAVRPTARYHAAIEANRVAKAELVAQKEAAGLHDEKMRAIQRAPAQALTPEDLGGILDYAEAQAAAARINRLPLRELSAGPLLSLTAFKGLIHTPTAEDPDIRWGLNGLLWEQSEDDAYKSKVVATNGLLLAVAYSDEEPTILPRDRLYRPVAWAKATTRNLKTEAQVDGEFPRYEQLLSVTPEFTATFKVPQLRKLLRMGARPAPSRVHANGSSHGEMIVANFDKGVKVSASFMWEGDPPRSSDWGFNPTYLNRIMGIMDKQVPVHIGFEGNYKRGLAELGPCLIWQEDKNGFKVRRAVLMPLRID